MTSTPSLTVQSVRARPVVVPLQQPIVSKVGLFHDWPLILIDLYTEEGVVGHSYLEPYLAVAARVVVPLIDMLGAAAKGQPVAPSTPTAAAWARCTSWGAKARR